MDGDFPWILAGALLLWLFNVIGGRKRPPGQRPDRPRERKSPPRVDPPPGLPRAGRDATQTEAGQLEELLRALEQRLEPTAQTAAPPRAGPPQSGRGPLGRRAPVPLTGSEELEERESLEADPVVESLEREVQRPERVTRDWLAQAEARERTRVAQVEARDNERQKPRHAAFDKRIREVPAVAPAARRLTTAEMRQAFIWSEILGRPKGEM